MWSSSRTRSIHDTSTLAIARFLKVSTNLAARSHSLSVGFLSIFASIYEPGTDPKNKNLKNKKHNKKNWVYILLLFSGVGFFSCFLPNFPLLHRCIHILVYSCGGYFFILSSCFFICLKAMLRLRGGGNGTFCVLKKIVYRPGTMSRLHRL